MCGSMYDNKYYHQDSKLCPLGSFHGDTNSAARDENVILEKLTLHSWNWFFISYPEWEIKVPYQWIWKYKVCLRFK